MKTKFYNLPTAILVTVLAIALLVLSFILPGCVKEDVPHAWIIKAGEQNVKGVQIQAYDKSYMLVSFYASPAWKYTPGTKDCQHRIFGYSDGWHEDPPVINADYSAYSLTYQCDDEGNTMLYAYSHVNGVSANANPTQQKRPIGIIPLGHYYYLTLARKDGEIRYGVQGLTTNFTGYQVTPAGTDRPGYLLLPYSEIPVSHDREYEIEYSKN